MRFYVSLMLCLLCTASWSAPAVFASAAAGPDQGAAADAGESGNAAGQQEAAEGSHERPASDHPLSVDPDLAIATLIIFVVLFIVLRKFAWGPIMAGLENREQAIAGDLDAAAARRQEAETLLSDYQRQLETAGGEVRALLDGAKKEAEAMKQSIVDAAHQAAADEKDRATREIETAKETAIAEIAPQSVNIAFRVASGALHREVAPADHQELIQEAGLQG